MADNGGCIIFLLSSTSTWEAQETLSLVSSYSTNISHGRNKMKIEPTLESDYDKNEMLNKPQEEKHFECKVCTELFNTKDKLNVHLTRHTGGKQYKCDKKFFEKSSLIKYTITHSVEKPYYCKICDKKFSQNVHLKEHSRIHTGEKPYKCNICEKRFTTNSNLQRHLRMHSGEKPYNCKICGKKFSQSGHLKKHSSIHTGEKS